MPGANRRRRARWAGFWLGVLFLSLGLLVQLGSRPEAASGRLTVRVLDIGQGDAILIDTPDNHHVLVDGGPDEQILTLLQRFVAPPESFALVVASHNHADHITGLKAVFGEYAVEEVWISGALHTSGVFQQWLETIKQSGSQVTVVKKGTERTIGAVHFEVLHPLTDMTQVRPDHQHDATVVLKVSYGVTRFLLTGDLELSNEADLLAADRAALQADVLKVSHQGSKGSSTMEFLRAVDPDLAIISVGPNSFGHPHQETLDRLSVAGIPTYRTDQQGTITITSDGLSVHVEPDH